MDPPDIDRVFLLIVFFIDLDGTIWDHEDASSLTPPFNKIDNKCLIDSSGDKLCLYDYAKSFLSEINRHYITCALSWNRYSITREIMEILDLTRYFDYLIIEDNPYKGFMMKKAIKIIETQLKTKITPEKIIYIDDRDIHINEIRNIIGEVKFIKMWFDTKNFKQLLKTIQSVIPF